MQTKKETEKLYYGWLILALCFFLIMCGFGIRTSMGVFIVPIENDLGWNRANISRVLSLGILIGAFSFLVVGYLNDKYGGKIIICLSLILLGISIILMSTINSILSFVFIYAFVGSFASSGIGFVTMHTLLSKWFFAKRSLAISISVVGGSFGPLLFGPLSSYLIETYQWRTAFVILGVFILFIASPLAVVFLKNNPNQVVNNEGNDKNVPNNNTLITKGPLFTFHWKDALKTFPFWQLSIAYLICGITTNILSVHFVPFAIDEGIEPLTAASIFGGMMGLNSIGVMLAAYLSHRISQKFVLGSAYAIRALAYLMLLGVGGETGMILFAVMAGMSWLPTVSMTSLLTADIYGLRNLGTLNGMSNMYHQIGGALCVLLTGEIQQLTGSYRIPFMVAGLTLIIASIIAFTIKEKKYSYKYNPISI